jgi:SAM-dependent methyltransferase
MTDPYEASRRAIEREWSELAVWWLGEGVDDPVYANDVIPLLHDLLGQQGGTVLDLGCGDGHIMGTLPGAVIGCDLTEALLREARHVGPVVRCRLPDLGWLQDSSVGAAYAVFVFEHLSDLAAMFDEAARVVHRRGPLVLVANHPAYTAAGAGPVIDESDGEVLWRWGPYFDETSSREPAGSRQVTYLHRPLGTILSVAAGAGWDLRRMVEIGLGTESVAGDPGYAGQEHMPRIIGLRWENGGALKGSARNADDSP